MLRPHAAYAPAYLDDVTIHSTTWAKHVQRVGVGGAYGQPGEVCSWTEGGMVSGVPLGRRAGAPSGGQDRHHQPS